VQLRPGSNPVIKCQTVSDPSLAGPQNRRECECHQQQCAVAPQTFGQTHEHFMSRDALTPQVNTQQCRPESVTCRKSGFATGFEASPGAVLTRPPVPQTLHSCLSRDTLQARKLRQVRCSNAPSVRMHRNRRACSTLSPVGAGRSSAASRHL
jgi:hypothetical protein